MMDRPKGISEERKCRYMCSNIDKMRSGFLSVAERHTCDMWDVTVTVMFHPRVACSGHRI